jgi:hypothetical protein
MRRGLGRDERLGQHFSASPEPPWRYQKRLTPSAYFCLARGTCVTIRQDSEPRGPPTAAPAPTDGTDVTVHSQQEHENHILTQHDLVILPRHPYLYSDEGNDHYTT